jgi:hypothetical protein
VLLFAFLLFGALTFVHAQDTGTTDGTSVDSGVNTGGDTSKLKKYHEHSFEKFQNHVPADVVTNHKTALEKADGFIKKNNIPDAITSKSEDFDLGYYNKVLSIGVLPYVKEEEAKEEIRSLIKDISNKTTDKERIKKENQKVFGGNPPESTTDSEEGVNEEDKIDISLHGFRYDADDAVDYAKKWTRNGYVTRNPDYDWYDGMNDCTNFVSQVLHDSSAGGISYVRTDVPGWDYKSEKNWYYSDWKPSWTWGGAHNLYYHLMNQSSNVRRLYYWRYVEEGDIIQFDMEPDDGTFHIGHSVVVTKKTSNSSHGLYVTYHTTDKEDEPLKTFLDAGYRGYAWAIGH